MTSAEREVRKRGSGDDRAVELDDRVSLAERLEEYEDLLAYLREH